MIPQRGGHGCATGKGEALPGLAAHEARRTSPGSAPLSVQRHHVNQTIKPSMRD